MSENARFVDSCGQWLCIRCKRVKTNPPSRRCRECRGERPEIVEGLPVKAHFERMESDPAYREAVVAAMQAMGYTVSPSVPS